MFFLVTWQCEEVIHNILQFITTKDVQLAHGNLRTIERYKVFLSICVYSFEYNICLMKAKKTPMSTENAEARD